MSSEADRSGSLIVSSADSLSDSTADHHKAPQSQGDDDIPKLSEELSFDPLLRESTNQNNKSLFDSHVSSQQVHLKFTDLRYEVDVGRGKTAGTKQILKGITGQARSGHVLAIMGASGAGKTTLLNLLAGRLSLAGNGRTSGSILVNGERRDFKSFRHVSAYVLQQDSFFPEVTVLETITLSAMLRLPASMPKEEKLHRVDQIIQELGLNKVRDTYVGNELVRGVSGGERKRVNIGTELVTEPRLVFLDEPTTGLDSFNAQNVMSTLLELAEHGRTIVTTIHQPRSSIYQMFDELMLLSEGHCLYYGTAAEAVTYFGRLGYACPDSFNPADYFLDLISLDQRSPRMEAKTKKRIEYLTQEYHQYREQKPIEFEPASGGVASPFAELEKGSKRKYATSFFTQFLLLSERSLKSVIRERANNIARFGQTVFLALLLGLIWLQEGGDESGNSVRSIAGALYFILINQAFGGIFGIVFLFPAERAIVLKERASRSYHVGAYFWSKTMAELPRGFLANLIFAVIGYFMVGLRDDAGSFFLFVLIIFLIGLAAEGVAYCVSALASDPQQAGAIAPIFLVTSMLFGGFFIGVDAIPVWLAWLKWLSFLKYGFAAAMQVEYEDRILDTSGCAPNTTVNACAGGSDGSGDFCPATGNEVLDFYQLQDLSLAANIFVLIGLAVGLRLLAYIILRFNGPTYDRSL